MFQGVACHFGLTFGLLTIPKCDLGEVEKRCFKVSIGIFNSFSAYGLIENGI